MHSHLAVRDVTSPFSTLSCCLMLAHARGKVIVGAIHRRAPWWQASKLVALPCGDGSNNRVVLYAFVGGTLPRSRASSRNSAESARFPVQVVNRGLTVNEHCVTLMSDMSPGQCLITLAPAFDQYSDSRRHARKTRCNCSLLHKHMSTHGPRACRPRSGYGSACPASGNWRAQSSSRAHRAPPSSCRGSTRRTRHT